MKKLTEQQIEEITSLVKEGEKIVDIAKTYGVSKNTVSKFIKKSGYSKLYREKRYRDIEKIKKAINDGERSLEKLAKIAHVKPTGFIKKYNDLIELPVDLIPYRARPEIDNLIDEGLTLETIGKNLNLSRERIRQYIENTAQYNYWYKLRQEKQLEILAEITQIPTERKVLLDLIYSYGEKRAEEEGFIYKKAWERYFNVLRIDKRCPLEFGTLVNLYARCKELKDNNIQFSYYALGEEFNMHTTTISRYLTAVGLTKERFRKMIDKATLRIIKRARKVKMPIIDVAYFISVNRGTLELYFKNLGGKSRNFPLYYGGGSEKTSYRTAAQAYESLDLGFTKEETIELLELKEKEFDYLSKNRETIERKIVNDLRYIYERNDIERAYQIHL